MPSPKPRREFMTCGPRGYNVLTVILPEFEFRGVIRRNVARYSMGTPEWPAPDFLGEEGQA
jgi:hypothetical protein